MKDYCLSLVAAKSGYNEKLNAMREYLQAYMLSFMYEGGLFRHAAFVGGTALRFLYNLPRFSEDLDFSQGSGKEKIKFSVLMKRIMRQLELAGYSAAASVSEEKAVQSAFVKFEGLMYEAGISPLKSQKFSIKIEIDSNPPQGAVLQTQIVTKYFPISFLSYEINSFFAGKLHALLSRKYAKGRDYFDLGWYLSKWKDIEPNLTFLTNALRQTGWDREYPEKDNWRDFISKVVEHTDWKKVLQDVEPFLENPSGMNIFSKENILQLLK